MFYICVIGVQSSTKHDCPEGFYCPNGTGADWKQCPSGTYSDRKNLVREQDCTKCSAGQYCEGTNLTEPTGNCSAGFYCVSGAASPNPYMTNLTQCPAHFEHITIGDVCPRGHFCKEGSAFFEGIFFCLQKYDYSLGGISHDFCKVLYHWRELFESSIYFVTVLYYARASLDKQIK